MISFRIDSGLNKYKKQLYFLADFSALCAKPFTHVFSPLNCNKKHNWQLSQLVWMKVTIWLDK